MTPHVVGALGTVLVFVLMFLGIPIGFAFAFVGGLGIWCLSNLEGGLYTFARVPFVTASEYTLTAVPMFILMGFFLASSGVAKGLFSMANKWLGRLPGGLAIATIFSCGIFGAVCGSATAGSATMGAICYPEMRRYKYHPSLAAGVIAIGGPIAVMIPPSLAFIIYGVLTETSIASLFIAGIIPGILEVLIYSAVIYMIVRRKPELAPLAPQAYGFAEKIRSLKNVWPVLILFLIVLGGMYAGVCTAIEAGGVGAIGALLVSLIGGGLSWKKFFESLSKTIRTAGMIFMLVIGAMIFNYFIALSGLPQAFSSWITSLNVSPLAFLSIVLLLYLPLGALMDELAMILLTIPIYQPSIQALGIDPIWFGVLVVLSCEIGMVAPPVGITVFVTKGVTKEPSLEMVFRGVFPFILASIVLMGLLVAFPQLSVFLPNTMK